jgi:hypothetical protein
MLRHLRIMLEFPISCSISRFQDRLYTYRKTNSQQTIGSTAKIHRKSSCFWKTTMEVKFKIAKLRRNVTFVRAVLLTLRPLSLVSLLLRVLTIAGILRKEFNSKKRSAGGGSQYEERNYRENRPQDDEKQTDADATASTFHRSVNIFIIRKRILFRHLFFFREIMKILKHKMWAKCKLFRISVGCT